MLGVGSRDMSPDPRTLNNSLSSRSKSSCIPVTCLHACTLSCYDGVKGAQVEIPVPRLVSVRTARPHTVWVAAEMRRPATGVADNPAYRSRRLGYLAPLLSGLHGSASERVSVTVQADGGVVAAPVRAAYHHICGRRRGTAWGTYGSAPILPTMVANTSMPLSSP